VKTPGTRPRRVYDFGHGWLAQSLGYGMTCAGGALPRNKVEWT